MPSHSLKNTIKSFLLASRIHNLTKPLAPFWGQILMFHRVCPSGDVPRLAANQILEVSPAYLETMIDFYTARGYVFVSLDQIYQHLTQGKQPESKFIALTFDDGYIDNLTQAYPILKKRGIPFAIYVTTNFPDRNAILWWYSLEDLILVQPSLTFKIEAKYFHFECTTPAQKEATFKSIRRLIINRLNLGMKEILQTIFSPYSVDLSRKVYSLALNWQQIKTLSADPLVTIGAHTVHHFSLLHLTDSDMRLEIQSSKTQIESMIEKDVKHFAYPFGSRQEAGDREGRAVMESGFLTATTTMSGNICSYHQHKLAFLPRFNINQADEMKLLQLAFSGFLPQTLLRY